MQQPQRIGIRFDIRHPAAVDLDRVIPVFHRWIQNQELDAMMIDVADYKHVQEGPGVIMLGHTDDFGIDNGIAHGSHAQGFYYVRKHARMSDIQPLPVRLQEMWVSALQTARLLEQEADLEVEIDPTRIQLTIQDRLAYPFTMEALALVRDELGQFFAGAFGTDAVSLSHREPDPRYPMTWQIEVDGEVSLADLLASLDSLPQTQAV